MADQSPHCNMLAMPQDMARAMVEAGQMPLSEYVKEFGAEAVHKHINAEFPADPLMSMCELARARAVLAARNAEAYANADSDPVSMTAGIDGAVVVGGTFGVACLLWGLYHFARAVGWL